MASINQYQISSAIEKAEELISASELASDNFYAELFDPVRVNISVFMVSVGSSPHPAATNF